MQPTHVSSSAAQLCASGEAFNLQRAGASHGDPVQDQQQGVTWQRKVHRSSYVMIVAYDGTEYNGFQAQSGSARRCKTVHAAIEHALCVRLQASPKSLGVMVCV